MSGFVPIVLCRFNTSSLLLYWWLLLHESTVAPEDALASSDHLKLHMELFKLSFYPSDSTLDYPFCLIDG